MKTLFFIIGLSIIISVKGQTFKFDLEKMTLQSIYEFESTKQSDRINVNFVKSDNDSTTTISFQNTDPDLSIKKLTTYYYRTTDSLIYMVSNEWYFEIYSDDEIIRNKKIFKNFKNDLTLKYKQLSNEIRNYFGEPWDIQNLSEKEEIHLTEYFNVDKIVVHHSIRLSNIPDRSFKIEIDDELKEFYNPKRYISTTIFYHYWMN